MGKTFYKHRPEDEREHVKNATRHGHAKYKKIQDSRELKHARNLNQLIERLEDDDDSPITIP